MLRIRNAEELSRFRALLDCLDDASLAPGDNVTFPVDVFRNARTVAALQYGDTRRVIDVYTGQSDVSPGLRRPMVEGTEITSESRSSWLAEERRYWVQYGDFLPDPQEMPLEILEPRREASEANPREGDNDGAQ